LVPARPGCVPLKFSDT